MRIANTMFFPDGNHCPRRFAPRARPLSSRARGTNMHQTVSVGERAATGPAETFSGVRKDRTGLPAELGAVPMVDYESVIHRLDYLEKILLHHDQQEQRECSVDPCVTPPTQLQNVFPVQTPRKPELPENLSTHPAQSVLRPPPHGLPKEEPLPPARPRLEHAPYGPRNPKPPPPACPREELLRDGKPSKRTSPHMHPQEKPPQQELALHQPPHPNTLGYGASQHGPPKYRLLKNVSPEHKIPPSAPSQDDYEWRIITHDQLPQNDSPHKPPSPPLSGDVAYNTVYASQMRTGQTHTQNPNPHPTLPRARRLKATVASGPPSTHFYQHKDDDNVTIRVPQPRGINDGGRVIPHAVACIVRRKSLTPVNMHEYEYTKYGHIQFDPYLPSDPDVGHPQWDNGPGRSDQDLAIGDGQFNGVPISVTKMTDAERRKLIPTGYTEAQTLHMLRTGHLPDGMEEYDALHFILQFQELPAGMTKEQAVAILHAGRKKDHPSCTQKLARKQQKEFVIFPKKYFTFAEMYPDYPGKPSGFLREPGRILGETEAEDRMSTHANIHNLLYPVDRFGIKHHYPKVGQQSSDMRDLPQRPNAKNDLPFVDESRASATSGRKWQQFGSKESDERMSQRESVLSADLLEREGCFARKHARRSGNLTVASSVPSYSNRAPNAVSSPSESTVAKKVSFTSSRHYGRATAKSASVESSEPTGSSSHSLSGNSDRTAVTSPKRVTMSEYVEELSAVDSEDTPVSSTMDDGADRDVLQMTAGHIPVSKDSHVELPGFLTKTSAEGTSEEDTSNAPSSSGSARLTNVNLGLSYPLLSSSSSSPRGTVATGTTDPTGTTGNLRTTGTTGNSRTTGTTGYSRTTGTTGNLHTSGTTGYSRTTGTTGNLHTTGTTGYSRTTGTTGNLRTSGTTGYSRTTGTTGNLRTSGTTDNLRTTGTTGNLRTTGTTGYSRTTGTTGNLRTSGTTGYSRTAGTTGNLRTSGTTRYSRTTGTTGFSRTAGTTSVTGSDTDVNTSGSSRSFTLTIGTDTSNDDSAVSLDSQSDDASTSSA